MSVDARKLAKKAEKTFDKAGDAVEDIVEKGTKRLEQAKDAAADRLVQGKSTASEFTRNASASASRIVGDLRNNASDLAGRLGDGVRSAADRAREGTADGFDSLAGVARKAASGIHNPKGKPVADLASNVADRLDHLSDNLHASSVDDIRQGAKKSVRERPVLVVAAAAAIGFMVTRLFKPKS